MSLGPNIVLGARTVEVSVALEPAHNAKAALDFMAFADHYPGIGEWISKSVAQLPDEVQQRHQLVTEGLMGFSKLTLDRSFESFPAYIDALEDSSAVTLRDDILTMLADDNPDLSPDDLLNNHDLYLATIESKFKDEYRQPDPEIHSRAFELMQEPAAAVDLICHHYREMWETILKPDWEQHELVLRETVAAFQQIDTSGLTLTEAMNKIARRDLSDWMARRKRAVERVIFVPAPHVGPYVAMYMNHDQSVMWTIFGAYIPTGTAHSVPQLARSELLVRLNALADDTRLRIVELLAGTDELCAPDIMERLELSQSAASRHLRQLSANGYLSERRVEGAKCYRLNSDRFEETLAALQQFVKA